MIKLKEYRCKRCGYTIIADSKPYGYCPVCGTDMSIFYELVKKKETKSQPKKSVKGGYRVHLHWTDPTFYFRKYKDKVIIYIEYGLQHSKKERIGEIPYSRYEKIMKLEKNKRDSMLADIAGKFLK